MIQLVICIEKKFNPSTPLFSDRQREDKTLFSIYYISFSMSLNYTILGCLSTMFLIKALMIKALTPTAPRGRWKFKLARHGCCCQSSFGNLYTLIPNEKRNPEERNCPPKLTTRLIHRPIITHKIQDTAAF